VPFFFVSCVIWEKKISRKNFYVALTFQDRIPDERYLDLLKKTLVKKRYTGKTVSQCAQMTLQA